MLKTIQINLVIGLMLQEPTVVKAGMEQLVMAQTVIMMSIISLLVL